MLTVNRQEISITRADTAYLRLIPQIRDEHGKFVDKELEEGDHVYFRIKTGTDVIEKECFIDYAENKVILNLVPSDTENLEFKTYYYEAELVTKYDEHFTFIEYQRFIVEKEIEEHE